MKGVNTYQKVSSATVHIVPHEDGGPAGTRYLPDLSNQSIAYDPVDSVIHVTSKPVGRVTVIPEKIKSMSGEIPTIPEP